MLGLRGYLYGSRQQNLSHYDEHSRLNYRKLRKIEQHKNHVARCPACGFGSFRRFYLGSEAATAVLGTELFEQLPNEEVTIASALKENQNSGRRSIFAGTAQPQQIRKKLMRQFLCFSDSRSEAAFFASYMERSYDEFLRRRGIWHIAEKYRNSGIVKVSVFQFVDELSRYFETTDLLPSGMLAKIKMWVSYLLRAAVMRGWRF